MKTRHVYFISIGICLLLLSAVTRAGWFGADFSADVVQGTAMGVGQGGKMYVGAGRVRTEMRQADRLFVEIIDPKLGKAWVLDQKRNQYQERSVPLLSESSDGSTNPCDGVVGARCQMISQEMINGRQANKWRIEASGVERLQWNDTRHGFPVKVAEGGQIVMAMVYIGDEVFAGRQVERWRAIQQSGQAVLENEQWYDPQLNIAIRQLAKDGSYKELRNIKLGPQASNLFTLPEGYQKAGASSR